MTEVAFGDYAPDVASVGTPKTSYMRNVIARVDGYGPIPSPTAFTAALPGLARGVVGAVQSDNSTAIFAANDTALFRLNATTRVWQDASKSGGYVLQPKELWNFTQFGNQVIATAAGINPQVYNLGSSTVFADLAGSPPQARRCAVVGDFLVLAGLTANPNRIQWSSINNINGWTPAVSQSDYQDFPDGGYVQGLSGGEYGLVFQDRAIRRMTYDGPPLIFSFQRISDDRGVLMRYSIAQAAGTTYFLSNDGFYAIDRGGAMTGIGAGRVDRTILADADLTDPRFMIGQADPASKRVIWFYKSVSNGNVNLLDKAIIYDWGFDKWTPAEFGALNAASVSPLSATLEGLDTIGNLDVLPYSLDTYTSTFASSLAVMKADGTLCFLSGNNMEATLDTPEGAIGNGLRTFIRDIAPVGDASGAMISVRHRDRLIDPLVVTAESALGVRGYAPQRVNARFNTARIRVPAGQAWTFARAVDVDAAGGGAR